MRQGAEKAKSQIRRLSNRTTFESDDEPSFNSTEFVSAAPECPALPNRMLV
jgi:hypothetical protein